MRITVLVNGLPGGALDVRARTLSAHFQRRHDLHFVYRVARKLRAVGEMSAAVVAARPDVVWVLDLAYAGTLGAMLQRFAGGVPWVLDTGDAIGALARSLGRSRTGIVATDALEWIGLHAADAVVVRGTRHAELLSGRRIGPVTVVHDGVDLAQFGPHDASAMRARLGASGARTVGIVGSVVWSAPHRMAYGWDLVEVVGRLRDRDVRGILVGDGDGVSRLRARARELGVEDRIAWVGRVSYDALPDYISAMDVCLSTQSNDLVGHVRTTGKLPLYMACGRYVIASDVGEAALVLPPDMRLPYRGVRDETWPARVAGALENLLDDPQRLAAGGALNRARAASTFDSAVLGRRLEAVLIRTAAHGA